MKKSYEVSSKRETSHVNPLTGAIEGRGGLLFLRDLFPSKQIVAYRSPGFCWSPPHLEALRDLGIQFDFSANISSVPVCYNGLTFYPYPAVAEWQGNLFDYRSFLVSILKNDIVVLASHPSLFVNQDDWDSIYWKGNPKQISPPRQRKASDFKSQFRSFDLLLRQIKHAEKAGLIEVTSKLTVSKRMLSLTKKDVERIYRYSMIWPKKVFSYYPTFLRYHFFKFFDSTSQK